VSVIYNFPQILLDGDDVCFNYLLPTTHNLIVPKKDEADIRVRISYHSHVFSVATKNGNVRFLDENNKSRYFCSDRHQWSLDLPKLCQSMIENKWLTWEEKDRNRVSNMAVIANTLNNGTHYVVFYYLFPSRRGDYEVELVVKSAYEKYINFDKRKRRFKVTQLIKKCYYDDVKVPK